MLDTKIFGAELKKYGYQFFSGVPCSFLESLINFAINDCQYIAATNEGDAVATCAGAYLGGSKSVFLCQNSGLTNAVSPLTSLNHIFEIPVLGFVSLRGEPGLSDEPQHQLMGVITTDLLTMMRIKWEYLAADMSEAVSQIQRADNYIQNRQSFFFVVKKGTLSKEPLHPQKTADNLNKTKVVKGKDDALPTRLDVLACLNALKNKDSIFLATTGKTGRELYEVEDAPNHFYMVGSMGCVSPIALGLALAQKSKKIIAIDGDGALLMRLGSMATNAYYSPGNMIHILLDNNAYDSTGGQLTVSNNIDFVNLAAALGYTHSIYVHNLDELAATVHQALTSTGLTFIYLKIAPGSKENLGRPKIKPNEVKDRLINFLNQP